MRDACVGRRPAARPLSGAAALRDAGIRLCGVRPPLPEGRGSEYGFGRCEAS